MSWHEIKGNQHFSFLHFSAIVKRAAVFKCALNWKGVSLLMASRDICCHFFPSFTIFSYFLIRRPSLHLKFWPWYKCAVRPNGNALGIKLVTLSIELSKCMFVCVAVFGSSFAALSSLTIWLYGKNMYEQLIVPYT